MKQYLNTIKVPIIIALLNVFPGNWLYSFLPGSIELGIFNIIRIANVFYAGWLITKNNVGGLLQAALSGPLLFLIDHILLKGGYFIIAQILNQSSADGKGFLAFGGVIVSYIMFLPLLLLVGFLGGWISRKKLTEHQKQKGSQKGSGL